METQPYTKKKGTDQLNDCEASNMSRELTPSDSQVSNSKVRPRLDNVNRVPENQWEIFMTTKKTLAFH